MRFEPLVWALLLFTIIAHAEKGVSGRWRLLNRHGWTKKHLFSRHIALQNIRTQEKCYEPQVCSILAQESPSYQVPPSTLALPSVSKIPFSGVAANALVTGLGLIATRLLQEFISPELIFILKWSLATVLLLPEVLRFRGSSDVVLAGLELGLWCSVSFLSQFVALSLCSGDKAAISVSLSAVMTPIIAWIAEKKNSAVSWKRDLAAWLSLCGVGLIELSATARFVPQDLFMLISPFFFAIYCYRSHRLAQRYPKQVKVITGLVALVSTILGFFFTLWKMLLPFSPDEWRSIWTQVFLDWKKAVPLLLLGLVLTGWSTLSDQESLQSLSADGLALTYSLGSIFTVLAAQFVFGDVVMRLGWRAGVGAALLIWVTITKCLWA